MCIHVTLYMGRSMRIFLYMPKVGLEHTASSIAIQPTSMTQVCKGYGWIFLHYYDWWWYIPLVSLTIWLAIFNKCGMLTQSYLLTYNTWCRELRLVYDVLQYRRKRRDTNSTSNKHSYRIFIPVLVTFSKWTVKIQLESKC